MLTGHLSPRWYGGASKTQSLLQKLMNKNCGLVASWGLAIQDLCKMWHFWWLGICSVNKVESLKLMQL